MIKNLSNNGKYFLFVLYNSFLSHGFVPSQWRDILIVPIPKPGRDNGVVSALRPISMISCMCKIFHSIIKNRLEWYIEKNNILSNYTVGFRRGRSTLHNLSSLISDIQLGLTNRIATIGCFTDIDNAYNNVDISSLIKVMDRFGIGSIICNYLWNFLRLRTLKIQVDNSIICRNIGNH